MAELNVSIPASLKTFIADEVAAGRFRSPEDYLVSLVREAQRRKAKARVESLLKEALDSDESTEATPEFWQRLQSKVERTPSKVKKP